MSIRTTILFAVLFGGVFLPCAAAQDELKFYSTIEDARDSQAPKDPAKPIVLYFGASWCAPCQQMKAVTFENLKSEEDAQKYHWVKFDIDDSPKVAFKYGVVSVPALIVLDTEGNPIGASGGFMTAERLLDFVSESIDNPLSMPPSLSELSSGLEQAEGTDLDDAVDQLIREIAARKRPDRRQLLSLVKKHKQKMQTGLVERLNDEELKVRAAASLALATSFEIQASFDPFADIATRKTQVEQIRKLLPQTD